MAIMAFTFNLLALLALLLLSAINAAPKFDTSKYLRVALKKPLGLNLEEVLENKARGVMIADVNDGGSAKASGSPIKGRFLVSVNKQDVRYKSFDDILDLIGGLPAEQPIDLEMVYPDDVFKGPAVIAVTTAEGKVVQIKTIKGLVMRDVLLGAGIELYTGSAKLTNCGGGMTCGTCVLDVTGDVDWEPRADMEAKRLKKYPDSCRLSCNTIVEGDVTVKLRPSKLE